MQQQAASLDRQVMLDFVKTLGASFAVGVAWSVGMALIVLALTAAAASGESAPRPAPHGAAQTTVALEIPAAPKHTQTLAQGD